MFVEVVLLFLLLEEEMNIVLSVAWSWANVVFSNRAAVVVATIAIIAEVDIIVTEVICVVDFVTVTGDEGVYQ